MHYQLTKLLILGCYLIHLTESIFIFNLTNTNKILCHSCKGNDCEEISNHEDSVVACNRNTQLCWAGFVDQQPYRTCASRFCTPSGISLDGDIHIEMCCHSNLCNNIPLSWSIWRKWYQKTTTRRPEPPATTTVKVTTIQTTIKRTTAAPQVYFVNEIVNGEREPLSQRENDEEPQNSLLSRLQISASDPATFGIIWEPVPYNKGFSNRVTSLSKLLVLILAILLILLF